MKQNATVKDKVYIEAPYEGQMYLIYNLYYNRICGHAPLSWVNFYGLKIDAYGGKARNIIGD